MRLFMIAIVGSVFAGMTVLAMANPAMLPQHPGYPSRGEFANDTGQSNLTYKQSIQEAAKSGDTTMGTMPIHPKHTESLDSQVGDPLSKRAIELPGKEDMRTPIK